MMKKIFIKPEAKALAMQTEQLMQTASMTQGNPTTQGGRPRSAQAKVAPRMGAISATDFAWN